MIDIQQESCTVMLLEMEIRLSESRQVVFNPLSFLLGSQQVWSGHFNFAWHVPG